MFVRFGLKVGNVKIGSMFLYILHRAIVRHGQRFIHTASSVNPTIVQKIPPCSEEMSVRSRPAIGYNIRNRQLR